MSRRPPSPLVMRALAVAEKRLGIEELCQRLGIAETVIRSWQIGVTEMPDKDFLRLIDIITDVEPDFWGPPKPK
jgi:transcriptional regulator with XRE-family HTH domain